MTTSLDHKPWRALLSVASMSTAPAGELNNPQSFEEEETETPFDNDLDPLLHQRWQHHPHWRCQQQVSLLLRVLVRP
jgi:hypothetical protein